MLDKLPLKKDYLLIIACLVMLFLSYKLAFQKTIEAWQINKQLTVQLTQAANLSYQPDYLQRKNDNLDKIISLYKADTASFRNNSISTISILAEKENVKLSEVPSEVPLFHTDKFIIQKLSLEGDFYALTKTLHTLQANRGIGIAHAVTYKVTREPGNAVNNKKLNAEVYLEIAK